MSKARGDRSPVLVGAGQVEDRTSSFEVGRPVLQLMAEAARGAGIDSGTGLLGKVDWLGVVDALSWELRPAAIDPALSRVLHLNSRHAETSASPSGNEPVRLVNDAANAIARGQAEVALVAGGEAMRSLAARRQTHGRPPTGTDLIRDYRADAELDLLQRYGITTPIDVYPFYEQATRIAWGQSWHEAQQESGEIWSWMSQVACRNPHAWRRAAFDSSRIIDPAPDNPWITYPYTKRMIANSSVNQSAALLLTSAARAREAGIAEDRLVYVGLGASAKEPPGNLDRHEFSNVPAMQVSIERALTFNRLAASELDMVELYSCFPCIPKMMRRILKWPATQPCTIYGGLTFGGGPIGNCMTHAMASAVAKLRGTSHKALICANGGFATKYHAIVLAGRPFAHREAARGHDCQEEADRLRVSVPPLVEHYEGPARLETFAIPMDRVGKPQYANLLVRLPCGRRSLSRVEAEDGHTFSHLMHPSRDAVGRTGRVGRSVGGPLATFVFDPNQTIDPFVEPGERERQIVCQQRREGSKDASR